MKLTRRLRLSLLTGMIFVALAAGLFGWVAEERRKRIATLTAELQKSEKRMAWAERMNKIGYVSNAQLKKDQGAREQVRAKLSQLGAAPKTP